MIALERITTSFGANRVLDELSLELRAGEVTAIVGSSGAGKSTLLRTFDLLERPDSGRIRLGDLEIDAATASRAEVLELRRRTAMVFQHFALFARKTALENVAEGPRIVRGLPRAEAEALARAQLERVGLGEHADRYPSQLSGGQQQRVGIARALAMRPELLLLDEPTSALDPELVGEVLRTIRQIADEGQTMAIVSHEMGFVRRIADRVLFIEGGRIIFDGAADAFFDGDAPDRARDFLRQYRLGLGVPDFEI